MTEKYKQLKTKDLPDLREKLHNEQNGICPLLGIPILLEDMCVDHKHKKNKAQPIGENDAGLVRGCIQRHANALEGKITNNWRRYQVSERYGVELPVYLRNLADYLEQPCMDLIHPSEAPKIPILSKSSYNALVKAIDGKQKIPEYRMNKSGKKPIQKLTKTLEKLFEKYQIIPEFYKQ